MASTDITFLHGQYVPRCTHYIDKVFADYFTLQYMEQGAVALSIGNRRYALEGQWCWSCYPGPNIRFHVADGQRYWVHRWIAFSGPQVARWSAEGLFPIDPQAVLSDISFGKRFDSLLKFAHLADRWSTRKAVHLLEGLLINLAETRQMDVNPEVWLAMILDQLEKHITQGSPDYPKLAMQCNMDVSTLRRRFRKATGSTPHEHLIQLRISKARDLLTRSDKPLKVIAQNCGYHDVFFFSRQFKQWVGMPPARYRADRQG
ncbi:MAG: AraC family transcriptional regulator [Phycisphaerales bacterium]|nr:AraC family transcriptional regulator [Phycisphaerales bacterium]